MSVSANTTMAIHPKIFPWSWLRLNVERRLAERYIDELDIRVPTADSYAADLSGGNQQKVSLARWLATNPKLLILDEPTQGVDVGAKAEIHRIIRRLAGHGLALLMISSDLPEVLGLSDRVAVMRGGTIAAVFEGGTVSAHDVMAAALGGPATRSA
jgi:rhamnose transport system ATP-binding protein